ncbi:MAG: hypothetical protein E6Q67_12860 [Roseateles sp.]|nr:MAG: hypothetical protein E6Q67_12860 [Roseateles sp.]
MGSIQSVKMSLGFKTAGERSRCGNCVNHKMEYVDRMPPYDRASIKCKLGSFMVTSYAICDRYQPERLSGKEART